MADVVFELQHPFRLRLMWPQRLSAEPFKVSRSRQHWLLAGSTSHVLCSVAEKEIRGREWEGAQVPSRGFVPRPT